MAITPQYNPRTVPSRQHIPISVADNQAQVSGRLEINPGQAVSPVIAQSGNKSSVPAPVTSEKRQRKECGCNSSASKPVTKKARLMMPPETQVDSSHTSARGSVNPRLGNNSANAGSSSSAPMERNTSHPRYGYFPVNLGPGSQQHQPVGRASASPKPSSTPTGAPAGPQNRVQLLQAAASIRSPPDPAVLEQKLKILREMVAKEDAILKKFEDYQQVYGPSLYAFYMGDKTSNPRPELRMMVTEQDEADMQIQGQALLQITKVISSTILQIIMNMTHEQSEPHFNSLMYFCKSAALRNTVPAVERVANTRLMASLILGE